MVLSSWVADEGFAWSANKMPVVRRTTHRFLTRMATALWTEEPPDYLPSDAGNIPTDKRPEWLAQAQAERVGLSRLVYLEPAAVDLAIQAGADLRTGHLPMTVDTRPPVPYGLMLCPSGLGYTSDGMQLIAVNWGPLSNGQWWVTWWADMREYVAWSRQAHGPNPDLWSRMVRTMGLLHHIHSTELEWKPPEVVSREAQEHLPQHARDAQRGEFVHAENLEAATAPEMRGATAALVGAWYLLTTGALATERLSPTPQETEADRADGITPSKITRAYVAGTNDPDRLWDYGAGPVPS